MREILIAKDVNDLNHLAATRFVDLAGEAIRSSGRFTVALAGGSTPRSLYRLLTTKEFRGRVDWSKIFFFFGDERHVPPDHPDSNYRMAKENLFEPLGIPAENIFRWPTGSLDPGNDAADYDKTIQDFFKGDTLPRFDLMLLGLGADGHTASLFPYSPALQEIVRLAVANPVEKLGTTRLTMTFPFINNAANIIFLVSGSEKAPALKDILEGDTNPEKYPAQRIDPLSGNLIWLIDRQASEQRTANHGQPAINN